MTEDSEKLTNPERRKLAAAADEAPLLQVGKSGISEALLAHIREAFTTHELLKIRAGKVFADLNPDWAASLLAELGDPAVQLVRRVGRTLLIYRDSDTAE